MDGASSRINRPGMQLNTVSNETACDAPCTIGSFVSARWSNAAPRNVRRDLRARLDISSRHGDGVAADTDDAQRSHIIERQRRLTPRQQRAYFDTCDFAAHIDEPRGRHSRLHKTCRRRPEARFCKDSSDSSTVSTIQSPLALTANASASYH